MGYDIIEVHISRVKAGDVILHDDGIRTVSSINIKYCNFMGATLFGDSYILGRKLVKKIINLKCK